MDATTAAPRLAEARARADKLGVPLRFSVEQVP